MHILTYAKGPFSFRSSIWPNLPIIAFLLFMIVFILLYILRIFLCVIVQHKSVADYSC